jgi:hypothetical protein
MNTSYDFEFQLRRSIRMRKAKVKTIWITLIVLSAFLCVQALERGAPYIAKFLE